MDNDSWNKLMMVLSVVWLVLIMFRLALYSSFLTGSESGRLFSTVLNLVLIVGLVLMGAMMVRRALPLMAAKVDREGHCQYCHGKLGPDDEFCPRCGAEIRR